MTTFDANQMALIEKAHRGLRNMSDLELAAWCAFIGDPTAPQGTGTREGLFRTYARFDSLQEIEFRSGRRPWRGVFCSFSGFLTRHLLGLPPKTWGPKAGCDVGAEV